MAQWKWASWSDESYFLLHHVGSQFVCSYHLDETWQQVASFEEGQKLPKTVGVDDTYHLLKPCCTPSTPSLWHLRSHMAVASFSKLMDPAALKQMFRNGLRNITESSSGCFSLRFPSVEADQPCKVLALGFCVLRIDTLTYGQDVTAR